MFAAHWSACKTPKQKAEEKKDVCIRNAVVIRRSIREEHVDDLSDKKVAEQCKSGTGENTSENLRALL